MSSPTCSSSVMRRSSPASAPGRRCAPAGLRARGGRCPGCFLGGGVTWRGRGVRGGGLFCFLRPPGAGGGGGGSAAPYEGGGGGWVPAGAEGAAPAGGL